MHQDMGATVTFNPHKHQHLKDAGTLPKENIMRTEAGMAHFAGTGPMDETCGSCTHWQSIPKRSLVMHCAKFRQMTGRKGPMVPVKSANWACRHWGKR
jgi:hypothetical protein